ncbi:hypothetical protein ASF84_24430 [Pseudomonas sp. Leaf127]|nr:hypothetical protein ASF84_24430 [Pseudomonas sp. Leaf127]
MGRTGLIAGKPPPTSWISPWISGLTQDLWEAALLAMAVWQAQQVYRPCWPHRRQAASHRFDVTLSFVPGTRLWEAALLAMAV